MRLEGLKEPEGKASSWKLILKVTENFSLPMFFAPFSPVPLSSGPTFSSAAIVFKNYIVFTLCPPLKFEHQLSFSTLSLWTQTLCLYPSWVALILLRLKLLRNLACLYSYPLCSSMLASYKVSSSFCTLNGLSVCSNDVMLAGYKAFFSPISY